MIRTPRHLTKQESGFRSLLHATLLVDYDYKLLKKHVGIEKYTLLDTA
ncbi:hypothetical protein [Helicobacter pylori]|nr:hypothetical protein [Helicobacter pylori]